VTGGGRREPAGLWRRLAALLLAVLAAGGVARGTERAAPIASYAIDATLDPVAHAVRATSVVRWRNGTAVPATELFVHAYLNAFANNRTTLMTEARGASERFLARHPSPWGGLDIGAVRVRGDDVTAQLGFVSPDDNNPDDRTLAHLQLAKPVRPGETIEIRFEFVARLPRLFMRAGQAAPFFFVAQWFPKLAVYADGRWQAHQYHAASEFFADFGTYDVTLTVPSEYVVGYTGELRAERANGDGTKTLTVHADDVHDFAWTADPRFEVVERQINDVHVRLLVQPQHRDQARRYLRAVRAAMIRYAAWFGPFPYPVLTIVDPGPGGLGAGGMEYPMLITVGTTWWMPAGLHIPEIVTVHELGHQYWYAAVATDEVNEPWLDEGINTYVEGLIMDDVYGPQRSYIDLFGIRAGSTAVNRLLYLNGGNWDPVAKPSYAMLDVDSYQAAVYAKTALVLKTLQAMLGDDVLRDTLRAYYGAWRFRHPTGRDWRKLVAAHADRDLAPIFAALLDGTGVLDYAVARVDVREVPPLRPQPAEAAGGAEPVESPRYRTEVIVERRGDLQLPVDIAVTYDDGSESRELWDGRDRWYRIVATSTHQALFARVDPDEKLPLDANRLNNSRMRMPATRGIMRLAGRWGVWLQGALLALTGF